MRGGLILRGLNRLVSGGARVLIHRGEARKSALVVFQIVGLLGIFSWVGALHVLSSLKRGGGSHLTLLAVTVLGGRGSLLLLRLLLLLLLRWNGVVNSLIEVLDDLTRLDEALVLLGELLVDWAQVELALAIGHILQVDVVSGGHGVGVVEDLVLLEIHL